MARDGENLAAKQTPRVVEMTFFEHLQKNLGSTSTLGNSLKMDVPIINEPDISVGTLDLSRINYKCNNLDCPHFDGQDFLGWFIQVQQFFESTSIPDHEKILMVMIHLEGKAL